MCQPFNIHRIPAMDAAGPFYVFIPFTGKIPRTIVFTWIHFSVKPNVVKVPGLCSFGYVMESM